jgi:YD repeat-containing protein
MPTPATNPTIDYISGCQTSGCGAACSQCAGGCGCAASSGSCGCAGGDGCACGTDCVTGTVSLERTQLATPHGQFCYAFSNRFSQGGSLTNPNFGMGTNFLPEYWAYATTAVTNEIGFIWGPNRAHWFSATSPYPAKYGSRYLLTMLTSGDYRLNDPDTGTVYVFDGPTGLLKTTTTPGGQVITNTLSGGVITQTARSYTYTQGGVSQTTTEVRNYDYYPSGSGGSSGLLQYVTLLRPNDTAAAIRRLTLTYYDAGDGGGNAGDLKTTAVQVLNGTSWQSIATEYYRYYTADHDGTPNTPPGYTHGLKAVVGPEAFARLSSAADPFTAPDAVVSQYADVSYQYTQLDGGVNNQRVTQAVTGAGSHVHSFTYQNAPSGQPLGYNNWYLQSTANQADGSQKITFSNYVRQTLLTDLWDTPGDQAAGRWVTYTTYDPTCDCPAACYTPAAINMNGSFVYDPTAPGLEVTLNSNVGLVTIFTYPGTGATPCYPQYQQVQQGAAGTPINVRAYTYTVQTVSSSPDTTIVLPASVTEYRSDAGGGSDPVTTTFTYTFFTTPQNMVQMQTRTTTLPQIPTSQNGQGNNPTSNPLYVIVETFDVQGRLIQQTDPYDSNNPPAYIPSVTYAYDEPTGALIQQVTNPYSGTPPSLSEYNLVTDYAVDELGRTLQTLGPTHNVSGQLVRTAAWTVYHDARREVCFAAGFATGSNNGPRYAFTLVNPVMLTRTDHAGRTTDQVSAVRESTVGVLASSDRFPQSCWVRWTHNRYDTAGDMTATRAYHRIPKHGKGLPGRNYDETRYGYDRMDRQNMVRSPGGTITRTVFDVRNNATAVYVGTSDVGATDEAPDGFSAPGNNMVAVQTSIYDGGDPVGGDGLLTTVLLPVDGISANDRRTDYGYDFRDRQTSATAYIVPVGTVRSVITVNTYDNLDRVIQVDQYDTTVTDGTRIRESQTLFDNLGRVYQTLLFAVPITGSSAGQPSTPQISNTWFNAQGLPVKDQPAGSAAYMKTQYDQVSRPSGSFSGYAASGGDDPWTIGTGDYLLEQSLLVYDAAGNVIQTTTFQRNQGATSATGLLTSSNSRVSFTGSWFDGANRTIAKADYGTTSFDRSMVTSPPTRSAAVLVTSTAYNERGQPTQITNTAGVVTQTCFDDAARVIQVIQNFQQDGSGNPDANITVNRRYTSDGGLATRTALNPATGDQTTRFLYGTTLTGGSAIARSDLLVAEVYPNATDATDQVSYVYNRQGQRSQMQDQNGTVHQYTFDGLGRLTSDTVTPLAAGVDGTVLRIDTGYEIRGMAALVTSYTDVGGTSAVNQVVFTYNQFAQLVSDAQNHLGAGGSPPTVGYGYADGTTNIIRQIATTYPNGRVLNIDYATGTEDDLLSRVTDLAIAGETTAAVAYQYYGVASIASVIYPMPASVTVQSILASGSSYPGFDGFGHIVNLPWTNAGTDLVELGYGYDPSSNRVYRQDLVAGSANGEDEIYGYDDLQRLTTFRRGALHVDTPPAYNLTSLVFAQDWILDPTGNWSRFMQFDGTLATNGLDQVREHDAFNEITTISQTVGTQWATPASILKVSFWRAVTLGQES